MALALHARENNFNGTVFRGDCVEIRANGSPLTPKEEAAFVVANVTDALLGTPIPTVGPDFTFQDYGQRWLFELDYSVLNSNLPQDRHNVRMTNPLASTLVDGISGKALARINALLAAWNASTPVITQNQIDFEIDIYQAIISQGFWSVDPVRLSEIGFTQVNYTQAGGIHRVQADYTGKNSTTIERRVMAEGGTVISNTGTVIVFDVTRATVRTKFLDDVKFMSRGVTSKNRWYVGNGVMNAIEGAGGYMDTDLATYNGYIRDKVAD